jgi:hypothetical protein
MAIVAIAIGIDSTYPAHLRFSAQARIRLPPPLRLRPKVLLAAAGCAVPARAP